MSEEYANMQFLDFFLKINLTPPKVYSIFIEIDYITKRLEKMSSKEELSFLYGYYAHLITDAELQRTTDERNIRGFFP